MTPIFLQQIHAFLESSARRCSPTSLKAPVIALDDFDGIITTGTRSYEALDKASGTGKNDSAFHRLLPRSVMPDVGIRGQSSGTAEQLADFILAILPHSTRLLYLTGDKNGPGQGCPVFSQRLKDIVLEMLNAPWWISQLGLRSLVTTVLATPKMGSSAAFYADFPAGVVSTENVLVRGDTGGSLGQLVSRADRPFLPHICEKEGRIAGKSHFTPRHASNRIALRLLPIAAGKGFASPAVAHFQPIADDTSTEPRTTLY
ncbi:hypothetical protein ARMGADRAFT_1170494 [Armillaria gallica]|uniref:Uncharacterized protein n=1 Tax=Armillaria gallica TaxID=47427 RepID=A0A2H3CK97_ARMGA|nr:hypothetical protein ARMGADRAFT_1170494 [Armillaria gallica]